MIEGNDPVVETHGQIGRLELVVARPRQALDVMAKIIAEQSRRAALERRQAGNHLRVPIGKLAGESRKRIALIGTVEGIHNLSAARPQPIERVGGDERIAAQRGVRKDTIEEQQMRQMSQAPAHVPGIEPRCQLLNERRHGIA